MIAKTTPRRLRVFLGIDELLDENVIKAEQVKNSEVFTMEINTGRTKDLIENFEFKQHDLRTINRRSKTI